MASTTTKTEVKITFNGESFGYVGVQWIGLEDDSTLCDCDQMESGENYHKELYFIESSVIVHDYIEKGHPEFKDATQISFEIKDGFFRQEIRDNSGNIIKLWMIPLSYLFNIECRKDEPSFDTPPINKLSKEEKQKAR
jgi:hypothetical protein